jgi:hypothetical protein
MTDEPESGKEKPNGEAEPHPLNYGRDSGGRFVGGLGRAGGGRQKGSRNHRTTAFAEMVTSTGEHPAMILLKVARGEVDGVEWRDRVAAASALMPYLEARPWAPRPSRFISKSIDLPPPSNASEATEQIVKLNSLAASGEISLDEAALLIDNLRDFAAAYRTAALEPMILELRTQIQETLWRRTPQ